MAPIPVARARITRFAALLTLLSASKARATTAEMVAVNGGDGAFDVVTVDGGPVYRASTKDGIHSGFMYFKRPPGVSFSPGVPLYVEVDYRDLGGPGRFGMQYTSRYHDFEGCNAFYGSSVHDTGKLRTAVFRLDDADLQFKENNGADLRLTKAANLQLHVVKVRVADMPSPLWAKYTEYLRPYSGRPYENGTPIDASTLVGKVIAGYQGWFRTPDDDGDVGWQHYIPDWGGAMQPSKIAIDLWPDMSEFTPAERHIAPGFTHPDGTPASLFSSDCRRTVLRHFQWMETWGIDGVALQRNADELVSPNSEVLRNTLYVRDAAHLTGRVWFVEYALRIPTTDADLAPLARDWQRLVDELEITSDPAYLHQNGLPVVGIYGFATSTLSARTAGAVLDIFQSSGRYRAFVAGAGEWPWRNNWNADYKRVMYRMGSWQPWNVGNAGGTPKYVNTSNWAPDKAELDAHGVMFIPQIYPGGSADNRSHTPIGTYFDDRLKGDFYWQQFVAAKRVGAQSVFVAMFDELDEGTQIFKVTNTPPTQARFVDYQGLPSDAYLCFTGQAGKMMRGQIPLSPRAPDCARMTQPSIPEPLSPRESASVTGPKLSFTFGRSVPAQGASSPVARYELDVDGAITSSSELSVSREIGGGAHTWRVRAFNTLGNVSAWSLKTHFSVNGPPVAANAMAPAALNARPHSSCACRLDPPTQRRSPALYAAIAVVVLAARRALEQRASRHRSNGRVERNLGRRPHSRTLRAQNPASQFEE